MLKKILFIGLGEVGESIIHRIEPLFETTNHQLATIVNLTTSNHKNITSINLNTIQGLSIDLICSHYQFIFDQLNQEFEFFVFIGEPAPYCQALAYIARQKNKPYLFCLHSKNKENLFSQPIPLLNIQNDDNYNFEEKVIDLSSIFFSDEVMNWEKYQLLLQCYQEIMPINISDEEKMKNEIEKLNTILELEKSVSNIFLLINNTDNSLEEKINELLKEIGNAVLIKCSNKLIKGKKLSIISAKKLHDNEIQLGLNLSTKKEAENKQENINLDDLSIPTFKRKGILIDQGF